MENTGFFFRANVPDALIRAAHKMNAALKSGMDVETLRTTLEICTAEVIGCVRSVYCLWPRDLFVNEYGDELITFGKIPFALPDLSALFCMEFLACFKPEELAAHPLLPMFFTTLPLLKRVEVCAVWARKEPEIYRILLTWMMGLWSYDCCSERRDAERDKILALARFDALRTILKFVKCVRRLCHSESDVRAEFDRFVAREEEKRTFPKWLSVEEICRNEDWAYAGAYDKLIPDSGLQPIVKMLNELWRKGSGPFAKMVRNGECDKMDLNLDQMFLYLVARSRKYDNLWHKSLKCLKVLVEHRPEVLKARDQSGDGALWQLFYGSSEMHPSLYHLRAVARYLIHKGCDPDEKSSIGLSYNDVMCNAKALAGHDTTLEKGLRCWP